MSEPMATCLGCGSDVPMATCHGEWLSTPLGLTYGRYHRSRECVKAGRMAVDGTPREEPKSRESKLRADGAAHA